MSISASSYYNNPKIILHEDFNDIADSMLEILKRIMLTIKNLVGLIIRKAKIPEICDVLVNLIRGIPLIGSLIPNKDSDETYIRRMLAGISVGNGIAIASQLLVTISNTIWDALPVSTNFKNDILMPVFDYNERKTFLQTLYKLMIDNDIPAKYANAYLVIISMKIPIYNILYVFKSFWSSKLDKSAKSKTMDDKLHPFTSGDPIYNENGLNETDQMLERSVRKFIECKRKAQSDMESERALTWAIIKDALVGILVPLILPMFNMCKIAFGVDDDNILHLYVDPLVKAVVMIYYYYFLVTAIILTSLAIRDEELANPSKTEEDKPSNTLVDNDDVEV